MPVFEYSCFLLEENKLWKLCSIFIWFHEVSRRFHCNKVCKYFMLHNSLFHFHHNKSCQRPVFGLCSKISYTGDCDHVYWHHNLVVLHLWLNKMTHPRSLFPKSSVKAKRIRHRLLPLFEELDALKGEGEIQSKCCKCLCFADHRSIHGCTVTYRLGSTRVGGYAADRVSWGDTSIKCELTT